MRKLTQDEIVAALIRLKLHSSKLLEGRDTAQEMSELILNAAIKVASGEAEI